MSAQAKPSPFVGILMLDTRFPRILGDAGNPESYPFPVRVRVVPGASAMEVVKPGYPQPALLPKFIAAAKELEADGAVGLVSTCGFLVHFQEEIARTVNVPVLVSALSLFPLVRVATGGRPLGILTASAKSLQAGALAAAGINASEVRVAGFEACLAFAGPILNASDATDFDSGAIESYAVGQARALLHAHPEIGGFLLECGNLPPYADAIRASTGWPVFGSLDAASMLWNASESEFLGR